MSKKGQSVVEYVMLTAIAAFAVTAMYTYIQRAVQAHIKVIEQQIENPEVINDVS